MNVNYTTNVAKIPRRIRGSVFPDDTPTIKVYRLYAYVTDSGLVEKLTDLDRWLRTVALFRVEIPNRGFYTVQKESVNGGDTYHAYLNHEGTHFHIILERVTFNSLIETNDAFNGLLKDAADQGRINSKKRQLPPDLDTIARYFYSPSPFVTPLPLTSHPKPDQTYSRAAASEFLRVPPNILRRIAVKMGIDPAERLTTIQIYKIASHVGID
jgi:hypothetical protein